MTRIQFLKLGPTPSWHQALRAQLQIPLERLQELTELGAIHVVGGARLRHDRALVATTTLRIHLEPRRFINRISLPEKLVELQAGWLVVDKPAHLPVHATVDNATENLLAQLEEYLKQKLYITHRIDEPTQGLLLVARTANAQRQINRQLPQIGRRYRALIERAIAPGTYTHYMIRSPRAPKQMRTGNAKTEGDLACTMRVQSCALHRRGFELEIELETGRTHQIRAQLQTLGAPIIGDTLYGGSGSPSMFLQAFQIIWGPRQFEIPRPW